MWDTIYEVDKEIIYNYRNGKFNQICNDLNKIFCKIHFRNMTIEDMWMNFKEVLINCRDSYIPISRSSYTSKKKGGIISFIVKLIKARNKSFARFTTNPIYLNRCKYTELRNCTITELEKLKCSTSLN